MPGPFYNNIKGTTAGTPGTGAFTPNAASAGFSAWSTVPTGWVGLVRYEDGSVWELQYSYWNGTTLSRSATAQFVSSSTGSGLTLTSAATAALVMDANEIGADFTSLPVRGCFANISATTTTALGLQAVVVTGTAAAVSPAATNYLTRQPRTQITSATTANAQAGWNHNATWMTGSSTAGLGGWVFGCRFGASGLPTGPRLFVGLAGATFVGQTIEPSAYTSHVAALALDSTDTNMQLLVNSNAAGGTKTDTGIPLVANGFYEVTIWTEPGSLTIYMLLVRLDTGAIYYGSTATDAPGAFGLLAPNCVGGLNGTNTGTAFVMNVGHYAFRTAG